jgi:hypothetical protein
MTPSTSGHPAPLPFYPQRLVRTPNIIFAMYRIKENQKPLAVRLLSVAEAPGVKAAGFMGDGPNDQYALAETPHSIAIAGGAAAARAASHVELATSAVLPDAIVAARLFHGGRAVVLRDIVFTGTQARGRSHVGA